MKKLEFIVPPQTYQKAEPKGKIKKESVVDPYLHLVRSLSQLMSTNKLYGTNHKIFKEHLKQVFPEVSKLLLEKKSISFFETDNTLLVNRKKIETNDGLTKRLLRSLCDLSVGYLILESGLTLEEFIVFIRLLCNEEPLKGEENIKQYLKEKGANHVLVRSATYKLVEEDEKVVKKGEVLAIEELSFEIRNRFLQDLKNGEVGKKLVKEERKYRELAHDPSFLSKAIFDLAKNKDNPEDLAKIIWLIGDYMIGEIDTAREEKINRIAIEKLKKQIFILWREKISKPDMEKHIQKTFTAISLASKIKGLILLYEKYTKNLEKNASQIQKILETLPKESQLYQQTKEKLDKIGLFPPQKTNK
ncbi:MAG: hypothetical protein KJ887_03140 [Candidatus Omnitrophica bacterium]|nr:hypothetical protein [Candidatus Omnitrophota bacterium]MBU1048271.1 hypothetical protein [Candidatus Omnitrophota bacterium]MBU1630384.1 hypothetical protein [Candidatus Omnitrophota bacterium]MBU1767644.1 hypothetical protein [Candidatus Omnitrophota bacterium]MBU1888683.1 hypothetical protein [Candidatus Omnitrophota bacterium]